MRWAWRRRACTRAPTAAAPHAPRPAAMRPHQLPGRHPPPRRRHPCHCRHPQQLVPTSPSQPRWQLPPWLHLGPARHVKGQGQAVRVAPGGQGVAPAPEVPTTSCTQLAHPPRHWHPHQLRSPTQATAVPLQPHHPGTAHVGALWQRSHAPQARCHACSWLCMAPTPPAPAAHCSAPGSAALRQLQ